MKTMSLTRVAMGLAMLAGLGACSNIERSRDTVNPSVSALTLAQQVCSNCHGVSGNATSPNFPSLAAQTPEYLKAQLKGFRGRQRQDPAGFEYMWGLSRGLTDAQIEGLAAYYAGQRPLPQKALPDAMRTNVGRTIFEAGLPTKGVPACASCHGDRAQGNAGTPRLAGQHADYLAKQLSVFQRGNERPDGAVMQVIAHQLNRGDIEDVAMFLQQMQP